MFESKPSLSHALPCAHGQFADEALTAFSWSDLISRLCATQDLRLALSQIPGSARASFDAMAAEHLANRHVFARHESKRDVNLAPSGNGKGGGAKDGSGATPAQSALRGNA